VACHSGQLFRFLSSEPSFFRYLIGNNVKFSTKLSNIKKTALVLKNFEVNGLEGSRNVKGIAKPEVFSSKTHEK